MEDWFQQVVVEEAPGRLNRMIRAALRPLAALYATVIEIYKLLFAAGILRQARMPCRVISVGNLTMGGVGKTVVVQSLARAIQAAGYRCVVLSYGFRAEAKGEYVVVSDTGHILLNVREAGDEAYLLAASLPGIPVIVGKRRALSAAAALAEFQPDVILMDDGFQYWRLRRDVDIVLLDARRPIGNGKVFPAGPLRELPTSLRRASVCLLTRTDLADPETLEANRRLMQFLAPMANLYETRHEPGPWRQAAPRPDGVPVGSPASSAAEWTDRMSPVMVVSGIAQNRDFIAMVAGSGVPVAAECYFPDHHLYSPADVAGIQQQATSAGAAAVVTTEKDAVKLVALWDSTIPLVAIPVHLAGMTDEEWIRLSWLPAREMETGR